MGKMAKRNPPVNFLHRGVNDLQTNDLLVPWAQEVPPATTRVEPAAVSPWGLHTCTSTLGSTPFLPLRLFLLVDIKSIVGYLAVQVQVPQVPSGMYGTKQAEQVHFQGT